jgi:rubredoxin
MPKVRLQTLYAWTCPVCQAPNATAPVRLELTPAERRNLASELGVGDLVEFTAPPSLLWCPVCGVQCETEGE